MRYQFLRVNISWFVYFSEVYISQKNFDLTEKQEAVAFQREMYNLASVLETAADELDDSKRLELQTITTQARDIKSFYTSGAWEQDKSQTLESIPEEPQDEDDLGVFGDDNVRAVLDELNYQVAYVAYGVRSPSIT